MCQDCGCGDHELVPVEVHQKILSANADKARHNRDHFAEQGVVALNLMGSPGSGKTALLEATARVAGPGARLGAVSGDLATDRDGERLRKAGIPAATITTGSACHLDASLVHDALHDFSLHGLDVFVIENVGNLVCPAVYDLGQAANGVALSVTEGEDKPLKYPVMFRAADLVLLTKMDLVPHLDVDVAKIRDSIARVMPSAKILEVSARTGQGMGEWKAWLEGLRSGVTRPHEHAHGAKHSHSHSHPHSHSH